MECGLFFNRHRWQYFANGTLRICLKCGKCHHIVVEGWRPIPYEVSFDTFKGKLESFEKERANPSSKQALDFLKTIKEPK